MMNSTITNSIRLFQYYKSLGEKAMDQIAAEDLNWAPDEKSNSINVIVKHLHGNMLSRWTDFLTTDGEKPWRNRDSEFDESTDTRQQIIQRWEEGWGCLFNALNTLTPDDLDKTVYVRNMGQTVEDAIIRQLAHYAYHVGQIVYLARFKNKGDWKSLTIPKGESDTFNKERFEKPQTIKHFTEDK
jgi:hypothetical protein